MLTEEQKVRRTKTRLDNITNGPNWKGGRIVSDTYVKIWTGTKYVPEHRLLVEKQIGRKLKPSEPVHHINGNTKDNELKNLVLLKHPMAHIRYHRGTIKKGDILWDTTCR